VEGISSVTAKVVVAGRAERQRAGETLALLIAAKSQGARLRDVGKLMVEGAAVRRLS
jgi:hypothetical protein